jgi:hypothetical protein
VGALVACAIAAAIKACAAAPVSVGGESPLGIVLPRAAALPSVEIGADVAEAMLALLAVPSTGLAARALDAAVTRAAGAEAPAALPDKTVETGGAVGTAAASGVDVMENSGGMPAPLAAWLPALS